MARGRIDYVGGLTSKGYICEFSGDTGATTWFRIKDTLTNTVLFQATGKDVIAEVAQILQTMREMTGLVTKVQITVSNTTT